MQEKFAHRRIVGLSGRQFDLQREVVHVRLQVQLAGRSSAVTIGTTRSIHHSRQQFGDARILPASTKQRGVPGFGKTPRSGIIDCVY